MYHYLEYYYYYWKLYQFHQSVATSLAVERFLVPWFSTSNKPRRLEIHILMIKYWKNFFKLSTIRIKIFFIYWLVLENVSLIICLFLLHKRLILFSSIVLLFAIIFDKTHVIHSRDRHWHALVRLFNTCGRILSLNNSIYHFNL